MADFDVTISDGTAVEVVVSSTSGGGAGVSDHGELMGLADDDHPQYHNNARGDARYALLAHDHDHIEPLEVDSRLLDDPPTDYPEGLSYLPTRDWDTVGTFGEAGWYGAVVTNRHPFPEWDTDFQLAVQFHYAVDGDTFVRAWDGDSWNAFEQLAPLNHSHDDRYYTQTESDARYSQLAHTHAFSDITGTIADGQIPSGIARDSEVASAISTHEAASDPHPGYQKESEKGQSNGYASLDGSGLVPDAQIPSAIARDSEVTSAISTHEAASDPHTGYQKESEKDQNSGYAGLNSSGLVPISRIATGTPTGFKFVRDDGTLVVPPGGGNISGAYDIEAGTYTDAGMSDEFASGTLNAKWTSSASSGTIDSPGQPGTSRYDLTSRSGTLLLQPAYSTSAQNTMTLRQADGLAVDESLVVSTALPTTAQYPSGTKFVWFILSLNSSTTSSITGTYNLFRVCYNLSTRNSNNPSICVESNSAIHRALSTDHAMSQRLYLRVTRKTINSTDSFVWSYSLDGISWSLVWMNTAQAFSQMWVEVSVEAQTNPSIAPVFPINWIRHVASTAHDLW